jgi:hypothetical protein
LSAAILRNAWKEKINQNPFSLSVTVYPVKDNGYGNDVEDKDSSPDTVKYTNSVRVGFRKKHIRKMDESGTPIYLERRVYFMVSDHETEIDIGLEFTYQGVSLKVMQRREIRKHSSLIGYEYELKEQTTGIEFYG